MHDRSLLYRYVKRNWSFPTNRYEQGKQCFWAVASRFVDYRWSSVLVKYAMHIKPPLATKSSNCRCSGNEQAVNFTSILATHVEHWLHTMPLNEGC